MTEPRKIIVTGGLGLIGSAIVEAWPGVATIIDDGRASVVKAKDLTAAHRPAWLRASVETAQAAAPKMAQGFAAVVHCAAPVGPVGILDPYTDVLGSIIDSTRAAIALARAGNAPLIVLSSSEVYGTARPAGVLQVPDSTWAPRWEYAVGKIVTEQMAGRHHAETGLPTCIIRPWNMTGPRQSADKGFALPRWADAALTGGVITVYGDGLAERAIMAVEDFAEIVADLINGRITPPRAWDAIPLDASTPRNRVTMRELAGMFRVPGQRPPRITVGVDPTDLHGGRFREAGAGSKLPPYTVALEGWTPLEEIVSRMLAARGATLSP